MAIHLRSTTTTADLPQQRKATEDQAAEDQAAEDQAAEALAAEQLGQRWAARPAAARVLRLVVLAVPIGASIATAFVLSDQLPHARHLGPALFWWGVVVAGSTTALFAVDRLARKLLPLAVLLRLSLLFPDQAPKRYRVAARSWNTRWLREQFDPASEGITGDQPSVVASTVLALLANLATHDRRTRGHCERVRAFNDLLTEEMGLPEADRDRLRWAALIHDIGKLSVPPRLLNKPKTPTAREWEVLRAHPLRGAQIAAPLAEWLGPWGRAIEEHHERWDGAGYPRQLAGEQISLGARIVAVADAFEVMTSSRPYSRPITPVAARVELAACAGAHFDPLVVRAFLNISIGRLRKVLGPAAWLAQVPILAGMPRLEAAFIGAGTQAVTNAGAAAGVVAATALSGHAAIAATHDAHTHVAVAHTTQLGPVTPFVLPFPTPPPASVLGTKVVKARSHHASTAANRHATAKHEAAGTTTSAKHQSTHRQKTAGSTAGQVAQVGQTVTLHGHCAGNAGNGLGNGAATERILADRGHPPSPGLLACQP